MKASYFHFFKKLLTIACTKPYGEIESINLTTMKRINFKNRFLKTLILLLGFAFLGGSTPLFSQPACAVEILQKQDPNNPGVVYLAANVKGEPPFKYKWSTGDTSQRIKVTQPGQYCVTIADAQGCSARACTDVDSLGNSCAVEITKIQGGPGTNLSNVVLVANPKGTPGFKFLWNTGETTQRIIADSAGTYCVTITDTTGCIAKACIEVDRPQNGQCDVAIRQISLRIPGAAGSVLLLAEAKGTEPFTFEWSTGETGRAILVNTSGEYCVKVTDANGCVAKACIKVNLTPPQACAVEIIQRQIPGPLGGTLLVAMPRGIAPFKFKWNTGDLNRVVFANRPGEYCVTMVDVTGCEAAACVRIGNPQNDSCSVEIVQRPSSTASGSGYVLIANARGEAPFKYLWSTGDTTQRISVNAPGEYCVKIIDANGCESKDCFVIRDVGCEVRITAERDSTGNANVVYLTAHARGVPGFSYLWNTGETTKTIRVEKEGLYCVTVKDSTGCVAKACFELRFTNVNDSCAVRISLKRSPTNTGVILVAEAKGKGPFKYIWSNGETGQEILVTGTGRYCVEIIGADGCKASACANWDGRVLTPGLTGGGTTTEFSLYPNPAYDRLVLNRTDADESAIVRIMRRDGQPALRSEWPNGSTQWEIDVQSLMPGTYFVQVINGSQVSTKTFFKQ